jgi:hypothetical protein
MTFITDPSFRRVTAAKVATIPSKPAGSEVFVDIFTVVGNVNLVSIVGVLTSSITGAGVIAFSFLNQGTGDASPTYLSAYPSTFFTTGSPLNSMIAMGNTIANSTRFINAAGRAALDGPSSTRILRPGTVRLGGADDGITPGTITGGQFTLHAIYEPHSPGAYMVPA